MTTRGYSLAHVKFILRHEHELRVHWHLLAALEYARRWIEGLARRHCLKD